MSVSQEEHRFDMDAEPEPIPDDHDDDNMSVMGAGGGSFIGEDVEGEFLMFHGVDVLVYTNLF